MDPVPKIAIFIFTFIYLFYSCVGNLSFKDVSIQLSQDVNHLKNEELGVPFVEKLFRKFKYSSSNVNPTIDNLNYVVQKVEHKIKTIFAGMDNATTLIYNLRSNGIEPSSIVLPCSYEKPTSLDVFSGNLNSNNSINEFFISNIFYQMRRNITYYKLIHNAMEQQYFITEKDAKKAHMSQFFKCSGPEKNIAWKNFMVRNKYVRKNVVLLLDHGGSLSESQLQLAKSVAKEILSSITKRDRVALIAVASDWSYPRSKCTKQNITLQDAKTSYLLQLNSFIDSLVRGSGATNHVVGMQKALEVVLETEHLNENDVVMVTYISRGLLSSLTEPRSVLKTIAEQTDELNFPLYIHTCAVLDELKPVMYETQFLHNIADQNFKKYNISYSHNHFRNPGYMLTVNKTDDIGFVINKLFSIFNKQSHYSVGKAISLPYWDPQSREFLISFTDGWLMNNKFSMLGMNVYFSNIVEDLAYFSSNQQYSYAFLIDLQGKVLVHPSLSRMSKMSPQLSFVDIKYIETVHDIDLLRHKLLSEVKGSFLTKNNNSEAMDYTWSRAGQWYIVCAVLNRSYGSFNIPFKASPSQSVRKLLYQNLDGSENHKFCRHLMQVATLDVASLYLSRSCFRSPFSASRTTQGELVDQGYLAYLKDDTGLLINPGLKNEVRDEVSALAHILDFLRNRHLSSEMSKYIVRRYASSYSGVLQMFPGSVIFPGLDSTRRPWFLRALQHKNKTIFIPPYLDTGGAGYIVTIAYATPQLVIAMDMTYGYMLKILLKYMPYCLNDKVTCFLIDDQGYIIYHPKLMDLNGAKPLEQQHIVHRESLFANDILSHKHFIKKLLCNDYASNTIQRYYRLNTSITEDLKNFVPSEHCVTYRITSVPDTNIFVGVINASCDALPAFCPCSIIDRLCLNCNRMEQKECECPCECPLESESRSCQETNQNLTDNLPCKWFSEKSFSLDANFTLDLDNTLESCFSINCQNERSHLECLGIIGCEWCRYDLNGDFLKKPFCSAMTSCFNGVFGSGTPYRGDITPVTPNESEYSPLFPILGLIIAMCLLIVLAYICYRSYTNPAIDRLYLSSTLRMSDLNINETFHDLSNHRDKLLKEDCPAPDPVSPYCVCVASNYRRNNTTAESDHGYSTMTPHDESEHLSLAPIEVDSLEDDVMSDSTSVHTSVSTKNNPSHAVSPMFTKIPHRNCMVVPVTVHRNMETT